MSRDYKKLPSEKQFNVDKTIDIGCSIYDWQFKRFKNRVERERYRNEFDAIKAKIESLNTTLALEAKNPTMPQGDAKRLEDDKSVLEKDLQTYKDKMEFCDKELNGVAESYEKNDKGELVRGEDGLPNFIPAQPGIETMIEALRELNNLYKAYIKIV